MAQVEHATAKGIVSYLEAVKSDFGPEHPDVTFELNVVGRFQAVELASDLSRVLLLAVIELVDNAKDAVGKRGLIRISARVRESQPGIMLSVFNSGTIAVGDRAFEEGVSTKGSGRGMGLAILKRMTQLFDGDVTLRQHAGVEFTVYVPIP